jgi:hypothetical protein
MTATQQRTEKTNAARQDEAHELRGLLACTEIAAFNDPGVGLRIGKVIAHALCRPPEPGWSRRSGR